MRIAEALERLKNGDLYDERGYLSEEGYSALSALEGSDVVPVVRCGECKFWTKQTDSIQGRCALFGMYPTSTWFCGNARREKDAEIH